MIRALWALAKTGVVVALVLWVAERPGTISIDWMQYKVTFHVGLFLLFMMAIVVVGIIIFTLIKTALDMPKTMLRYRDITNKDKGMRALSIGLTAVAAGDSKAASYQAHRAKKFLAKENALSQLLEAQAARLDGREMDASRAFIALMDNKDSAFLGIRGLLQSALDCGDYKGALELGHRALVLHPKQDWILCVVYDLEIKARNWDSARKILYRAEKYSSISTRKANSDRVAMLLAEAEQAKGNGDETLFFLNLNKAYKVDWYFVPTVLRLARMYLERGKRKAAISVIEKAWKHCPHPGLVVLWEETYKPAKENDLMARVRWFEKLLGFSPESVEGLQALASALIQEGLWGEARKHLEKAEEIRPNVNLYKIWATLEDRATHDEDVVRMWLEKAADAPRERVWICSETGREYDQWAPLSDQGLFNTIIWDFPQGRVFVPSLFGAMPLHGSATNPMLEAPKE
ncbi:MAG: heme biosynthesis protein HemY [Zetaproteobacteria bacterium]|nr:MAG: heme biosynthesis protein HemY [Zetaproteobacteria bacterium]